MREPAHRYLVAVVYRQGCVETALVRFTESQGTCGKSAQQAKASGPLRQASLGTGTGWRSLTAWPRQQPVALRAFWDGALRMVCSGHLVHSDQRGLGEEIMQDRDHKEKVQDQDRVEIEVSTQKT